MKIILLISIKSIIKQLEWTLYFCSLLQSDVNGEVSFDSVPKYSLEQLAVPADELPSGVDPSCKEVNIE